MSGDTALTFLRSAESRELLDHPACRALVLAWVAKWSERVRADPVLRDPPDGLATGDLVDHVLALGRTAARELKIR